MSEPNPPPSPSYQFVHSQISRRSQIIDSIRSPLGFFCLALLIVEAFLIGSMFFLSAELQVIAFFVGILLFLMVFGSVLWLVVKHPTNLIFGERSQLEFQAMQMWGQSKMPMTGIELRALPVTKASVIETQQLTSAESEQKDE